MIKVFIDNQEATPIENSIKLPLYRASSLRDIEGWREGRVAEFEVEASAPITQLLGHCEEAYPTAVFNDSYHTARIEADGVTIIEGVATLIGTKRRDTQTTYHIRVRVGGAEWADSAAMTRLNATAIEATRQMLTDDIIASWSDNSAVRMLPINRDRYAEVAETGIYTAQRSLLPQDYHPFISVVAIVESIAKESGYTIQSNFLNTPFARKLMISGAYKRVESEQAYATMGFKAVRSTTTTAKASQLGRVEAAGNASTANVGAVVDTVNPNTLDESGTPCRDAYDNGGCFSLVAGVPTFHPKRDISVAFDLRLHYTTDYRIVSSSRLKGFDKIYLGDDCHVEIGLQNHIPDRRASVASGIEYKLFIFDYDATTSYLMQYVGYITSAISTIKFDKGYKGSAVLMAKRQDENAYTPYSGDWALYDGHVEERGQREVDITIRTPYAEATPTSPRELKQVYLYGAEQGMELTLHAGCSLTPIFGGTAGYGESVEFRDIANHDISQAEFLEAIAHLFNLCIYTHRPSRRLFIEPYDDFFDGSVVDWRDRQLGGEVVSEECAVESFATTALGYQPSDGATKRLTDSETIFGEHRYSVASYAAKQSVKSLNNPLFMATASMQGAISAAPSATLLTVGERDIVEEQEYINPRIALYHGMETLPDGEYWPMCYAMRNYPLVAFHSPERGESLCFEDRDGCEGLHHYYDRQMLEMASRQRITMDIALRPADYIALFDPDGEATIRSQFRLQMGGNTSLFRLEEIVAYDAERGVARCKFQRLISD